MGSRSSSPHREDDLPESYRRRLGEICLFHHFGKRYWPVLLLSPWDAPSEFQEKWKKKQDPAKELPYVVYMYGTRQSPCFGVYDASRLYPLNDSDIQKESWRNVCYHGVPRDRMSNAIEEIQEDWALPQALRRTQLTEPRRKRRDIESDTDDRPLKRREVKYADDSDEQTSNLVESSGDEPDGLPAAKPKSDTVTLIAIKALREDDGAYVDGALPERRIERLRTALYTIIAFKG